VRREREDRGRDSEGEINGIMDNRTFTIEKAPIVVHKSNGEVVRSIEVQRGEGKGGRVTTHQTIYHHLIDVLLRYVIHFC
jgi:hypothetical protein